MRQLHLPFDLTTPLEQLSQQRTRFKEREHAKNTLKGYAHDWKMFHAWCDAHQVQALPAATETVSLYLTDLISQGRKVSTAVRRTSSISHAHRQRDLETPINDQIWSLLSRARDTVSEKPYQVMPLRLEHVEAINRVLLTEGSREALRDRALITFGFATAFRRSTLCELLTTDIAIVKEGITVHIRFEKQDQKGRGRSIGIPRGKSVETCPVMAVEDWLKERGATPGRLFTRLNGGQDHLHAITGPTVLRRVRLSVEKIGLDPKLYGGHSMRAGFITEAGCRGLGELLIAQHTGHRSMDVLRKYFRHSDLFRSNVAGMLGF